MFHVRFQLLLALSSACLPSPFCWGELTAGSGWEGGVAVSSVLMWLVNDVPGAAAFLGTAAGLGHKVR